MTSPTNKLDVGAMMTRKPLIDSPDILARIEGAKDRLRDGHALMRIPVDPTDPDCVLADAELEIKRLRALLSASKPTAPAHSGEPDCWAILTPNGSRLVSPDEAKGRRDAYPLYAAAPAQSGALNAHERNALNEAVKQLPSISALRTLRDRLLVAPQPSQTAVLRDDFAKRNAFEQKVWERDWPSREKPPLYRNHENGIATTYRDPAVEAEWQALAASPAAPAQSGEPVTGSPAFALRGLYKPAMEYFLDGKPVTPNEYIAWQCGIIEAVTKAKLPDPKYYGGSAEEGDQHEVKCAYVDGWNECRALILAAPQPAQTAQSADTAAQEAGFSDFQSALNWIAGHQCDCCGPTTAVVLDDERKIVGPVTVDRTHKNQAYVTIGFGSVDECSDFLRSLNDLYTRKKPRAASPQLAQTERALTGWQPIDTAPEGKLVVVAWLDKDDPDNPERHMFDFIEDGGWVRHNEDYDHYLCVAPPGSRGPSADAPYTHWLDIPEVPTAAQPASGETE